MQQGSPGQEPAPGTSQFQTHTWRGTGCVLAAISMGMCSEIGGKPAGHSTPHPCCVAAATWLSLRGQSASARHSPAAWEHPSVRAAPGRRRNAKLVTQRGSVGTAKAAGLQRRGAKPGRRTAAPTLRQHSARDAARRCWDAELQCHAAELHSRSCTRPGAEGHQPSAAGDRAPSAASLSHTAVPKAPALSQHHTRPRKRRESLTSIPAARYQGRQQGDMAVPIPVPCLLPLQQPGMRTSAMHLHIARADVALHQPAQGCCPGSRGCKGPPAVPWHSLGTTQRSLGTAAGSCAQPVQCEVTPRPVNPGRHRRNLQVAQFLYYVALIKKKRGGGRA